MYTVLINFFLGGGGHFSNLKPQLMFSNLKVWSTAKSNMMLGTETEEFQFPNFTHQSSAKLI